MASPPASDTIRSPIGGSIALRVDVQEPISSADRSDGTATSDSDAWLAESGAELEAELQRVQTAAAAPGQPRNAPSRAQEAQLNDLSGRLQAHPSPWVPPVHSTV